MGISFFDEPKEQSLVKTEIVTKYFWAWAKVVIPSAKTHGGKIAYIDLFAGPGRYNDGSNSTPLLVLQRALEEPDMCRMLVTIFNDANSDNSFSLQKAIRDIPGIEKLTHRPQVYDHEVGEEIVRLFESMHFVPTLFFVDPWGYKGLSLRLVNSVLKDWGCDCIFFFNYNRINMGLGNDAVKEHIDSLFGAERAEMLRVRLESADSETRELTVVEEIASALSEMGGRYVLPFRFKNSRGTRTSHHLIFVSKHVRGYEIMKGIMARGSSSSEDGVASFEYTPVSDSQLSLLFALSRPLDELAVTLLARFAGRTISVRDVYQEHNVGTPFVLRNYKDALLRLEAQGAIAVDPAPDRRPKRTGTPTLADACQITFPDRAR